MFEMSELADPAMAIDPVHDGRHRLAEQSLAREASAYIVVLPEHQLAFFTYTYVSAQGQAGAKIAIFAAAGEQGNASLMASIRATVLRREGARVQKDRKWFAPFGFDTIVA